jgi:hypothetical protein
MIQAMAAIEQLTEYPIARVARNKSMEIWDDFVVNPRD